MAKILIVNSKESTEIIETRKPLGKFICNSDPNWIVAIDNASGDAWTEQFKPTDLKLAHDWLNGKIEMSDLEDYYDKKM